MWEPRSINSNKNNNSIDNSRLNDLYPPLYGESTPFYIASRLACPRIAELLPHVKMIVLLREPVARAYSEYQMKKRRVDIQNDFVGLMQLYAQNVSRCMLRTNGDLMALKLCVPASISSHSHWNRFTLSQSGRYGSGIDETNRVKSQGEYSVRKHSRMRSKTRRSSGASRSLRVAGDQMVSRCYAFTPQHVDETSGNHVHRQLLVDYSNKTSTPSRFNDCINHTVRSTQTSPITTKRQLSLSDTTPDNIGEGRATSTEKLYFQPHACMGKYAREVLLPLREAFEGEAQTFRECAGSKYSKYI